MYSQLSQDVSLYELALGSEHPPQTLQVSLATLQSMVGGAIDLLIEQQISATLWIKPASRWEEEISRYRLSGVPHNIYISHHENRELIDENYPTETATENLVNNSSHNITGMRPGVLPKEYSHQIMANIPPMVEIELALESLLHQEYFLLFISNLFCGLIIAHRPRSIKYSKAVGKDIPRQHLLLAACSFDNLTLGRVWSGIKQAIKIEEKELHSAENINGSSIKSALLATDEILAVSNQNNQNSELIFLNHLLSKQIQRQEEIWHLANNYMASAAAAEALRQRNEELLDTLRLKDDFLSNVGQELRTPLTNMKTALTLLNSPHLKAEQRVRYMQVLNMECDRQTSRINGLLDLVQLDRAIEHDFWQPLNLADIVPGVVSTYQPLAQEKGVMLAYTIPDDLPSISSLRAWLKQIVINLLHNSLKFTPAGGQVWVKAKQQGEYVQLEFTDTGVGIPPSEIPKIFDCFYRGRQAADEDPSGAGLGLTIVQKLLLHCGGSISVKSHLGKGSTFNVLLPIFKQEELVM